MWARWWGKKYLPKIESTVNYFFEATFCEDKTNYCNLNTDQICKEISKRADDI
jgi:hypothetical protein